MEKVEDFVKKAAVLGMNTDQIQAELKQMAIKEAAHRRTKKIKKAVSFLTAVVILFVVSIFSGGKSALKLFVYLIVIPLPCIWFGENLGNKVGGIVDFGMAMPARIDRKSPAWLVEAFGWLLLFMPLATFIYLYFTGNKVLLK